MKILASLLACAGILLLNAMPSAVAYPTQRITLVVPYPPGGITDTTARLLAEELRAGFNQPVIVENRPGGNGTIGLRAVVNAQPDGYTLLVGSLGGHVLPATINLDYPVNVRTDLTPISGIAQFANVLVVAPTTPVNSLQEFIAFAKEKKGELTYASAGIGTADDISAQLFSQRAGLTMRRVPFRGGGASLNALLGNHIDTIFEPFPVAKGHVSSGQVKAIAVTAPERLDDLKDIPTIAESGFPGYNVVSWLGLFGPSGVPPAVVTALSDALVKIVRQPDFQQRLGKIGLGTFSKPAPEFAAFNASEIDRWAELLKGLNTPR